MFEYDVDLILDAIDGKYECTWPFEIAAQLNAGDIVYHEVLGEVTIDKVLWVVGGKQNEAICSAAICKRWTYSEVMALEVDTFLQIRGPWKSVADPRWTERNSESNP